MSHCDHGQLYLYITVQVQVPIAHNSAREVQGAIDMVHDALEVKKGLDVRFKKSMPVFVEPGHFDMDIDD